MAESLNYSNAKTIDRAIKRFGDAKTGEPGTIARKE